MAKERNSSAKLGRARLFKDTPVVPMDFGHGRICWLIPSAHVDGKRPGQVHAP